MASNCKFAAGKVDEKATQLHAIASLKVLLDATKPQDGANGTAGHEDKSAIDPAHDSGRASQGTEVRKKNENTVLHLVLLLLLENLNPKSLNMRKMTSRVQSCSHIRGVQIDCQLCFFMYNIFQAIAYIACFERKLHPLS